LQNVAVISSSQKTPVVGACEDADWPDRCWLVDVGTCAAAGDAATSSAAINARFFTSTPAGDVVIILQLIEQAEQARQFCTKGHDMLTQLLAVLRPHRLGGHIDPAKANAFLQGIHIAL